MIICCPGFCNKWRDASTHPEADVSGTASQCGPRGDRDHPDSHGPAGRSDRPGEAAYALRAGRGGGSCRGRGANFGWVNLMWVGVAVSP
jgi:hypothetical protein